MKVIHSLFVVLLTLTACSQPKIDNYNSIIDRTTRIEITFKDSDRKVELDKKQVENQTHFKNTLVVIPSGIRLDEFKNPPSKEISRQELNLPKDGIILGMAGRFDPKKGQLLVVEAMRKAISGNDVDFDQEGLTAAERDQGLAIVRFRRWPSVTMAPDWPHRILAAAQTEPAKQKAAA